MSVNKIKVIMIDSWVGKDGNDYALHLCKALKKAGIDITLVVTDDNVDDGTIDFPFLPISPSKTKSVSKYKKLFKYYNYLLNVYKSKKNMMLFTFNFSVEDELRVYIF